MAYFDVSTAAARWAAKVTKREAGIFDKAQARAKVRTTTIVEVMEQVALSIALKRVALKQFEGCDVLYCTAVYSDFPRAYTRKWTPEGTLVRMTIKGGRPVITDAYRACKEHDVEWRFTDAAKSALVERAAKE